MQSVSFVGAGQPCHLFYWRIATPNLLPEKKEIRRKYSNVHITNQSLHSGQHKQKSRIQN